MKIEVLIATVNCDNPKKLAQKMNIQSEAIICNQCNENSYKEFQYNGNLIKVFNFNERGVGLNRNNALMRATADVVLFADDDEVLKDDYKDKILSEFKKNKNADMFVFNIEANSEERKVFQIKKQSRVYKFNCLRYGAVRMAVKLDSIRKKNIMFSLLFGGGCKYGSGEDSIFIDDCLKKGLKVYSSTKVIAEVDLSESSWFKGYNEKFFFDKGALLKAIYNEKYLPFVYYFIFKHPNMYKSIGFKNSINCMKKGAINFKKGN